MKIIWVFCVILFLEVQGDFDNSTNWVDSLMKYIAEETDAYQVTIVTNFKEKEWMKSLGISKIFNEIMGKFPTRRINIADFDKKIENYEDASTTFFIMFHESYETLSILPSTKIIDTVMEISAIMLRSKFLLVRASHSLSDSHEKLLKYAWSKHLLDFTIVELGKSGESKNVSSVDDFLWPPVIHQLNPFKKEYTMINWTQGMKWFPDKSCNMWGHPLNIGVFDRPPFSRSEFNEILQPVSVRGANIILLETIARELNFSLKYLPNLQKFYELSNSPGPRGLHKLMQSGKIDILANLSPHFTTSAKYKILRTTTIMLDKYCPVVPVLPRLKIPLSIDFFKAYLVCFAIVMLFWLLALALRFHRNFWQPFNVCRVLLGVSVPHKPMEISERTLFAGLLIVSSLYSSTIYTALTDISLKTNAEMEFNTFDDLDNSGLIPVISNYVFNKTFDDSDGPLLSLKKKSICSSSIVKNCPDFAVKYKNVTCIMSKAAAMLYVQKNNKNGLANVKISTSCFWTDSTAFLLGKGSPYRENIDHVLTRIATSGLKEKWYTDRTHASQSSVDDDSMTRTRPNMNALRQQLFGIGLVGYSLSILVFIGEIAVNRISKYRLSKK